MASGGRCVFGHRKKQMTGIEPASSAWEADVLPMNYICMSITIAHSLRFEKTQIEKVLIRTGRAALQRGKARASAPFLSPLIPAVRRRHQRTRSRIRMRCIAAVSSFFILATRALKQETLIPSFWAISAAV